MSIKLMQLVWDRQLPQSRKFLLLALADQANDAGECWPSINTLAARCSMARRTVFDGLADLQGEGWLERELLPNQRVRFRLDIAKLQQLPLDPAADAAAQNAFRKAQQRDNRCKSRTSAESALVRHLHGCNERTGADSGGTGADSALHKATPNKSIPHRGDTRTRAEQLEVMGSYDRSLVQGFLTGLPDSIELQVLADYLKHCQVKRGPVSISGWMQTRQLLLELQAQGVDLNESLRETMRLQLVKPVDPRVSTRRGGAPPSRPRANDDLSNASYTETPSDELPPELRNPDRGTGTDG